MYTWFAAFFAAALASQGMSSDPGAAIAAFAVIAAGGPGCWLGGLLADRWGRTRTNALMMILSGSCAVLIGFLFGSPTWLVLVVGWCGAHRCGRFGPVFNDGHGAGRPGLRGDSPDPQLAAGFTITVRPSG